MLPTDIPDIIPVEDPIVAIEVLPEVHEPPGVISVKLLLPPVQVANEPPIAAGWELTVTVIDTEHPVPVL